MQAGGEVGRYVVGVLLLGDGGGVGAEGWGKYVSDGQYMAEGFE